MIYPGEYLAIQKEYERHQKVRNIQMKEYRENDEYRYLDDFTEGEC
jgi:hypothetical protein